MFTKLSSVITYLIIFGLVVFLILMFFEPKSGSEPATKGIGRSMVLLAVVAVVFLLVFNLQSNNLLKYIGLALGLLCVAALIVFLLALSGSSLFFQDTRRPYKPEYHDPVLNEMFEAFQNGKVNRWKTLLESHPEHLQHKQLLKDILNDITLDKKSSGRKLASLKYMLESGAKLDTSTDFSFVQIAYTGMAEETELLLQHGANPNCSDMPGHAPVIFNTIGGYDNADKVIEVLIKYGADPNTKRYGEQWQDSITPLFYAAYLEKWTCCKVLLENGADPEYKSKEGVSIKEYILQKVSKTKEEGYSPHPDLLRIAQQLKLPSK